MSKIAYQSKKLYILTLIAVGVTISFQWVVTFTGFPVVGGSASGTPGTWVLGAKGLTLLFGPGTAKEITHLCAPAVIIASATHFSACYQWVSLHAPGAETNPLVELCFAFGIAAADNIPAGIHTVFVFAFLVQGTVIVNQALICEKKVQNYHQDGAKK